MELRPGTVTGFGKQVDVRLATGARSAVENSGAGEPTVGRIDWTHDEDHLGDGLGGEGRARRRSERRRREHADGEEANDDGNAKSSHDRGHAPCGECRILRFGLVGP